MFSSVGSAVFRSIFPTFPILYTLSNAEEICGGSARKKAVWNSSWEMTFFSKMKPPGACTTITPQRSRLSIITATSPRRKFTKTGDSTISRRCGWAESSQTAHSSATITSGVSCVPTAWTSGSLPGMRPALSASKNLPRRWSSPSATRCITGAIWSCAGFSGLRNR